MTDLTPAQAAQQNNRDRAGQYSTKVVDESVGVTLEESPLRMMSTGSHGGSGPKPVGDHWYAIERQYGADLVVGPFVTEAEAESAMNDSLLADSLCQEDCLDAYTQHDKYRSKDADVVYIDRDDADHFGEVHLSEDEIPADATVHEWEENLFGADTANPGLAQRVYALTEEGDRPYLAVSDGYHPGSLTISAEFEGQAQDAADKAVTDGLFVNLKDGNTLHGEEGAWTFDVSDNDRYGDHTTWTGDQIDW